VVQVKREVALNAASCTDAVRIASCNSDSCRWTVLGKSARIIFLSKIINWKIKYLVNFKREKVFVLLVLSKTMSSCIDFKERIEIEVDFFVEGGLL
jgi:hypothetical protein